VPWFLVNVFQLLASSCIRTTNLDLTVHAPSGIKKRSQYGNRGFKENSSEFVSPFRALVTFQIIKMVQNAAALMATMEQFNLVL